MQEFPTIFDAIANGFRWCGSSTEGNLFRKEMSHGIFVYAVVRYAKPDQRVAD